MLHNLNRIPKAALLSITASSVFNHKLFSLLTDRTAPLKTISRLHSIPAANLKNKIKKFLPIIILVLIIVGVLLWVKSNVKTSPANTDDRVQIKGPKLSQTIMKEYLFPIKDEKGTVVTQLKYTLESAELRDEILVKGERMVAVQGRTFLILNLKINNSYSKAIDINARDFIRLTVNNKDKEMFAADIHNDPVEVQPNSTKVSRIGFPISDTDKNMKLFVGEISGDKKTITLNLK